MDTIPVCGPESTRHSGCRRLREEVFDGVTTVVIDYWKRNPEFDPDGIAALSGLKFRITETGKWTAEAITLPRR
ncbi:hypothetical protein [Mesorhizobium sp. M0955]|uniref:hypothetical protein n=1 Tax=unclassified Mesorhizobium TaxID=325217 RepID=UPI00333BBF43